MRMHRLGVALGVVLAVLIVAAPAAGYTGATVRGTGDTDRGPRYVRVRIVCPPGTRSTPRPGDFSFCRGNIVLTRNGRVVGSAPISVRTNDQHLERVLVRPGSRGLVPPRSTVRLAWQIRSHDGEGNFATRSGTVLVRNRLGP